MTSARTYGRPKVAYDRKSSRKAVNKLKAYKSRAIKLSPENRNRGLKIKNPGKERSFAGVFEGFYSFLVRLAAVSLVLAILGGASLGLIIGYRWLTTIDYFALRTIEIAGVQRLNKDFILGMGGLAVGQNVLLINISDVESAIAKIPWVENVSVKRILPSGININIQEKVPAYLKVKDEILQYVDASGNLIDKVEVEKFASLPQLEIEDGLDRHLALLMEIREYLASEKSGISLDRVAGFYISWSKGLEIYLSDRQISLCIGLDNWELNLSRVNQVVADLDRRGEMSPFLTIVSEAGKVWVEKKENSFLPGQVMGVTPKMEAGDRL